MFENLAFYYRLKHCKTGRCHINSLRTLLNHNRLKQRSRTYFSFQGLRTLHFYNHLKQSYSPKLLYYRLRTLHFIAVSNTYYLQQFLCMFENLAFLLLSQTSNYFQGFSECFIASPYGSQTYRRLQCRAPSIRVPHWHCKFFMA